MRRFLQISIIILMLFSLSSCSSGAASNASDALDKEIEFKDISSIKVNESWSERSGDNSIFVDLPDRGMVSLTGGNLTDYMDSAYLSDDDIREFVVGYFQGLFSDGTFIPADEAEQNDYDYKKDGLTASGKALFEYTSDNSGTVLKGYCRILTNGGNYGVVIFMVPKEDFEQMDKTIQLCIATLHTEYKSYEDALAENYSIDDVKALLTYIKAMNITDSTAELIAKTRVEAVESTLGNTKSAASIKLHVDTLQNLINEYDLKQYETITMEEAKEKAKSMPTPRAVGDTSKYLVGDNVEIRGIVSQVSSESFTIKADNLEFKCFPASNGVLKHIAEGKTMTVKGTVMSKSKASVNLSNVTFDDYGV